MDTRFWGPSGWQLYHLIALSAESDHKVYVRFFRAMNSVLPCKYCRESATQFLEEDCDMSDLPRWMYDLHNKVNHKLRVQCRENPGIICPGPDPSLKAVLDIGRSLLASPPDAPPGLDFLFCVAYNYSPPNFVDAYKDTFGLLAKVYPYPELRKLIGTPKDKVFQSREALLHWWYSTAKKLCLATHFPIGSFRGTLMKYGRYKSGCTRGKTCRNGKKVRNHRKTYKITHERLVHIRD